MFSQVFTWKLSTESWPVSVKEPDDDWLYDMRHNVHRQCQFLITHKLVSPPVSSSCHGTCQAYLKEGRDEIRNKLPYGWKCTNCDCKEKHHFLECSFVPARGIGCFKHIQLLYKFYCKRTAKQAALEMRIGYGTVKVWFDYYRRCISHYMQHHFHPNFEFDGDAALEYDEAKLSAKQKFNVGRRKEPVWVLGGIQRRSRYVILKVVENRNGPLLQSIIQSFTSVGSTVITDGWSAYLGLSGLGYYHWTVKHAERFVDTMHGHHTQNIENLWMNIRGDLRAARGVQAKHLQKWLDVFAFRQNMSKAPEGVWVKMCCVIGMMQQFVHRPSR